VGKVNTEADTIMIKQNDEKSNDFLWLATKNRTTLCVVLQKVVRLFAANDKNRNNFLMK